MIVGVTLNGKARAYPLEILRKNKIRTDTLAGRKLTLTFDPSTDQLAIRDDAGNEVPFITGYWFVWKGMYPETDRFGKSPGGSR
jgi:hypothetical protein